MPSAPVADDEWIPSPRVTARTVGPEIILADLGTGACWQINATGAALWRSLLSHGSLQRAIEDAASSIAEPRERVVEDMHRFAEHLVSLGVLIRRAAIEDVKR